ncbi:MAG: hypothetical protein OJF55_000472 [Rhodanobacteraceae bacterium]|jgi:HD-GYP domain-containing protein (c-di-GMP phosphodiesterase class II)|nr:MAG: hypothetical protein OJF55_000472 [Rhodanobacteraceae bacterium]
MTTQIEETRIDIADLELGMYVCRLDRPWEGTPFPLQGVEVRSEEDIAVLRALCKFVYIDRRRTVALDRRLLLLKRSQSLDPRFRRATNYANRISLDDELPRAHETLQAITESVDRIYSDVAHGRELSVEQVEEAVRPLVASVLRSADAFLFLEGLRKHDDYTYSHAIACGALAAAFGRHLGLQEGTIVSLATGGLLMDVGKTKVDRELLQRVGPLTDTEAALVHGHVEEGVAIVTSAGINDPDVLDVMRTHHERCNGSGYPDGIMESGIPMAGRMLAIIDTYDAMISARPYRTPVSRHAALQAIYRARGRLFQTELVEQFQVCLGVYPTGSCVELSTGELAVVMEQNQVRRLRPRVLVISTPDKQPLPDFRTFDLLSQSSDGHTVEIVRNFAAGEHAIDTAGFLPA